MSKREPLLRIGSEKPRQPRKKKLDHLTQDVLAAEKAGQSYGQWKAKHPNTYPADEDEKPAPLVPRPGKQMKTCLQCGAVFEAGQYQTNKIFCSDSCRLKYNRVKASELYHVTRTQKTAVCVFCGKTFAVNRLTKRYCSKYCSTEAERMRQKEYRDRRRKEVNAPAACVICGKDITEKPIGTKYCGKYCAAEAKRLQARAAKERQKQEETANV